jgi:3-methyladenine DNA glycosylase AlkD
MSRQLKEIQSILKLKSDSGNTVFFRTAVPGKQKIYGVKTPELNELAKKYKEYSFSLAEELWNAGALEEKIIAIKIIEKKGKSDPAKTWKLFNEFSRQIDNWAVCDGLGMQFLRGLVHSDTDKIFRTAEKLNQSKDFWQRRLSLVMVEYYTREKEHLTAIRKLMEQLENDEEYYVRKAVSWMKRNIKKGK